jgi:plasmid maintenance system antidote protein VapI
MSLSQQLREAIEESGLTLYRVAKDSGLPYAVLHHFANKTRGLTLESADKLAEFFGMHLTRPKQQTRKRGK